MALVTSEVSKLDDKLYLTLQVHNKGLCRFPNICLSTFPVSVPTGVFAFIDLPIIDILRFY